MIRIAVLGLMAAAFAGFGVAFTVAPDGMAATIDIALPTDAARIDFVATYGGFEIGFAIFLAICTRRAAWVQPGLIASGCALGGFTVLRGAGILLSDAPGGLMYALLAMEAAGCALAFWAATLGDRLRRRQA